MYSLAITLTFSVIAALPVDKPGVDARVSRDAYEVAVFTARTLLPEALQPVLSRGLQDEIFRAESSFDTGVVTIWLDVGAANGNRAERIAAAKRFPRRRKAAHALYERHQVQGGYLPWEIEGLYETLAADMTRNRWEAATKSSHRILLLATAAALPFNTTTDRLGIRLGNLSWLDSGTRSAPRFHRTVRHRVHVEMVRRMRGRLEYEVRVSPDRVNTDLGVIDAVFDVLLDSYRLVDDLARWDREATGELGINGRASFVNNQDAYYMMMIDRAAPVLEDRIESAALLGASLITKAWARAGRPSPPQWSVGQQKELTHADAESTSGALVGSRHSKIYHRINCPHAARIKPDNLVRFESFRRVQEAGRKACKTCKPDESRRR